MDRKATLSHPSLACQEHSSKSKEAWLEAYRHGCLYKAFDKDVHYSHIKALSGRQFGRSTQFENLSPLRSTISEAGEDGNSFANLEEVEEEFQPNIPSPVIFENLTLPPPAAIDDTEPVLFTTNNFLAYLSSPEWSNTIRLRVVGGELLRLLNRALVSLEKRRLVHLHSIHANANNRVKRLASKGGKSVELHLSSEKNTIETAAKDKESDITSPSKGKLKPNKKKLAEAGFETDMVAPKTVNTVEAPVAATGIDENTKPAEVKTIKWPEAFKTDAKWEYEKLGLEMVFYEKCDMSNTPYIVSDLSAYDYFEDFPPPKTLLKPIKREPYTQKVYQTDKMRLPPYEDLNLKEYIASLELELLELKEKPEPVEEAKPKDLPEKSKGTGKDVKAAEPPKPVEETLFRSSSKSEAVELIAENPYLEPEVPASILNNQGKKLLDKTNLRKDITSRNASITSQVAEQTAGSQQSSQTQSIASNVSSDEKLEALISNRKSKESSEIYLDNSLMDVSGSESGSFTSLDSAWMVDEINDEFTEDQHQQKLNLTRTELYVSSLYAPREENRRLASEKLEMPRRVRSKQHGQLAKKALAAASQRAKGDLYSSFKHLAKKKEAERIRATRPNVVQRPFQRHLQKAPSSPFPTLPKIGAKLQTHEPNGPSPQHMPKISSQYIKAETQIKSCKGQNKANSTDPLCVAHQWESYRRAEDICEMESALKNDLEKGLLERMRVQNLFQDYKPMSEEQGPKGKPKNNKNKSQNQKSDVNTNGLKKYPMCNLFLSLYGRTVKITQPVLKQRIINNSFCTDGKKMSAAGPLTRSIGFESPKHLINYLVNVRNATDSDARVGSWQSNKLMPVNPAMWGKKQQRRCLSSLYQNPLDGNNSSFDTGKHRRSKAHLLQRILDALEDQVKSDHFMLEDGEVEIDANTSAAWEDAIAEDFSVAHDEDTKVVDEPEVSVEVEAEAEVEAEVEAEREIEDESKTILQATFSELLKSDLKCYDQACTCEECEGQLEYLADLKPTGQIFLQAVGCPPLLGRLRRDYNFLKTHKTPSYDAKSKLDSSGRFKLPKRALVFDTIQIGEQLLELMEDIMIRKEILSSSRNFTYITITFTKKQSQSANIENKNGKVEK